MPAPDIRVVDIATCPVCGGDGQATHDAIPDRLFGVPGAWRFRRCVACDAVWLANRPVDDDLGLTYRNYYTHTDTDEVASAAQHAADRLHDAERGFARKRFGGTGPAEGGRALRALVGLWAGRRADAAYMAAHLPVRSGAPLLDVGCGDGLLLQNLRSLGWDVQGVEPDAAAATAARGRGLTVFNGGIEDAGFPDATFEAVTMSHVVEHLSDPARTLAEVHRVLRPGGTFAVMTPNARSALYRVFGKDFFPLDPPRHLLLHSPASLERLLHDAGFVVEVRDSWRAANVTIAASLAFRRGRGYSMTQRPSTGTRIVAELGQQLLAMAGPLMRGRGDELVAIARKPSR